MLNTVVSTCSCERNGSPFEFIHSKKRNRVLPGSTVDPSCATDLVFVFSNLHLSEKGKSVKYTEEHPEWNSDAE